MYQLQFKKFALMRRVIDFHVNNGPIVAGSLPKLAASIAELKALDKQIIEVDTIITMPIMGFTKDKKILIRECKDELWRLVLVMQSHFIITENTEEANNIKISESAFYKLSESAFYNFSQVIMNLYDPAVYNTYSIDEAAVNALKAKLQTFPNDMLIIGERRHGKREALKKLKSLLDEGMEIIKLVDRMIKSIKYIHNIEHGLYFAMRPLGMVRANRGKPQHKGKLVAQQIKAISKQTYRHKLALIVENTGNSPIMAGISLDGKQFTGTPFIIPPGKLKRRISQRLAAAGEHFLLQNMGADEEDETGYRVWMKE